MKGAAIRLQPAARAGTASGPLAYANSGPGTNSSEFFITDQMAHNLDGNYTIFGQCDRASLPVVSAIARVPRNAKNKPLTPVVVKRITVH